MGPPPSKFSLRKAERTLRPRICSPGSWRRIPVSSQVSGPPHRVSWPRIGTEGALASTRTTPLDLEAFCDGANTLYICSAGRRQRQFAPLVVAILGDVRDAAYARSPRRTRRAAHAARPRRSRQHRADPRPPLHGQRGRWAGVSGVGLPAGPLPGRRVSAGGRRPTASCHCSAQPWSCAASPTHRRCVTSARWPATGRSPARPSASRWAVGAASALRPQWAAPVRHGCRSTPSHTARRGAHSSWGRTKRSPRSRSLPRTPAHPGVTCCLRPSSPPSGRPIGAADRPIQRRSPALHRPGLAPSEPGPCRSTTRSART